MAKKSVKKPVKKTVKKVEAKTVKVQRYVHFEKVAKRKAEGWKAIEMPKTPFTKVIKRGGGDLVLMEKS